MFVSIYGTVCLKSTCTHIFLPQVLELECGFTLYPLLYSVMHTIVASLGKFLILVFSNAIKIPFSATLTKRNLLGGRVLELEFLSQRP